MSKSALGVFIAIGVVVLVAGGVVWGIRSGEPEPAPSAPGSVGYRPVDPAALEKEIEALQAMRDHLLPLAPAAPKSSALQTEQDAGVLEVSGDSGVMAQPPAPPKAPGGASTYAVPPPVSAPKTPPASVYIPLSSPAQSYSPPTFVYGYLYDTPNSPPPQNSTSVPSLPPAPVFLAAPGTRTYTVTTGRRFCEYVEGTSMVFLSGYPFPQDVEIYSQDIVQWSMASVTFRLPFSFPTGSYAVTVRGYQKYGYCDDVKPGFIKVQ
ncbi:MAG: hypothetical protein HYY10_00825 [Candidatus Liptonbacteria bacterium]|nr:hypothetical protein [Candidatus Liptonbacteria bacterium]